MGWRRRRFYFIHHPAGYHLLLLGQQSTQWDIFSGLAGCPLAQFGYIFNPQQSDFGSAASRLVGAAVYQPANV